MFIGQDDLYLVCVLVIILFMIVYLIFFTFRANADDFPLKCEYIDPLDMKNGDIVSVSYYNLAGAIITGASKSIWSHTGTIYFDPITNIRYVIEGAIYRVKKYRHFFKIPLETWLYFNRYSLLGYKKYRGPQIDSEYLLNKFETLFKNCTLEAFNIFWSRFLVDRDYYEYHRLTKYTCMEATIILGQEMGIFKKDKIYNSYFPDHIVNNKISLCDGISYDPPIKFMLHPTNSLLMEEDQKMRREWWKN